MKFMLMRHAKSVFALNPALDHERSLSPSGRLSVAPRGHDLIKNNLIPEQIYCSDALRCQETYKLLTEELSQFSIPCELTAALYLISPQNLIQWIQNKHPKVNIILVIGHNPTLEGLVSELTNQVRSFQPADLAVLVNLGSDWVQALEQKGSWQLQHFFSVI